MLRLTDPLTQVIILGVVCFCCPGMFNAIGGLGAFGLSAADANVGNDAGIALGAVFAVSSLAAGGLFNLFGHRLLLLLGGTTYILYVASYLAYNFIQSIAFVVVAAMLLGLGAGWLWCAQGAIMMGYPLEGEKGRYFSTFWAIFNAGGVVGSIIPMASQWNSDESSKVSTGTYIGFMCIMGFGTFLSLLLLPASKITRSDGSPVARVRYSSPMIEIKGIVGLFKDWRMLALFPMFFTSNWFYPYQFTGVNGKNNGTIRTRSFNSCFYWGAQVVASLLFGAFLDRAVWSRTTRARYGFLVLITVLTATWGGGIAYQSTFGPEHAILGADGKYTIAETDFHSWDLVTSTAGWAGPFVLYFMYGACDAMFQAFAYWLMGSLTNDMNVAARYSGFYKFAQNIGGVFAPLAQQSNIGNTPNHPENAIGKGMGEILICVVLLAISVLCATPVVLKAVKDTTAEDEDMEQTEFPADKHQLSEIKA